MLQAKGSTPVTGPFTPALFAFLRELKKHNDREWFQANKNRYEEDVKGPMLRFIGAFAGPLEGLNRNLLADPRPAGGSMFRIYRDTRFAGDKSPTRPTWGPTSATATAPGTCTPRPSTCTSSRGRASPPRGSGTRTRRPCARSGTASWPGAGPGRRCGRGASKCRETPW